MMARANDVIDYYLNGPGSYWDAGPRKPLGNEDEDGDSTLNDLKKFKDSVIASKQFADDPGSIMDSVIDLIDRARGQIAEAARSNRGIEGIWRLPPPTEDPIDDPRVISPRLLNGAFLPIGLPGRESGMPPQASEVSNVSNNAGIRILGRRVASRSP